MFTRNFITRSPLSIFAINQSSKLTQSVLTYLDPQENTKVPVSPDSTAGVLVPFGQNPGVTDRIVRDHGVVQGQLVWGRRAPRGPAT